MDFFDQQQRTRRQSRVLVVLFLLATLGVVVAVDGLLLALVAATSAGTSAGVGPRVSLLAAYGEWIAAASIATFAIVLLTSGYKWVQLRAGGGAVARSLGATYVRRSEPDPGERQLLNVVDEMAIASGLPVPQVYVLEEEEGINAFAAGFEPGNAAIAVTRGALETLSRDELQGVVAHEFSHILNGDMRLNMQLTGLLHGLVALGVVGRWILRWTRVRGGGRAAFLLLVAGIKPLIVSAIGVFFGRLIKAAVSRQREFLADASAVQLTRAPEGLAGALRKVLSLQQAHPYGLPLVSVHAEEVSHMLFSWRRGGWWSTHPPLEARISALDPSFTGLGAERNGIAERIGRPTSADVERAAAVLAAVPAALRSACTEPQGAAASVLALLISGDALTQNAQLEWLGQELGPETARRAEALGVEANALGREQYLPVLELAQPSLCQLPAKERASLLRAVHELRDADGELGAFEVVVSRVVESHIEETRSRTRLRPVSLSECRGALVCVLATLADEGSPEPEPAYAAGIACLPGTGWPAFAETTRDLRAFERGLVELDALGSAPRRRLIEAAEAVIRFDGKVNAPEAELLRAVCDALRCPLPLLGMMG